MESEKHPSPIHHTSFAFPLVVLMIIIVLMIGINALDKLPDHLHTSVPIAKN